MILTMSNTYKALIVAGIAAVAFASGRWLAPTKIKTEIKTVEVEKKTDNSKTKINRDTTQVEITKPDGTKEITTKTHETTDTADSSTSQTLKSSDQTKEVAKDGSKVTLSILAGAPIRFSDIVQPIYGGIIMKPILGPITVGIWGLSNSTGGVSLGLSF